MNLGIRATQRAPADDCARSARNGAALLRGRPFAVANQAAVHLAVAVAYFATAKLGLATAFINGNVTAVWVPSGLATAAILVGGLRFAPALWLAAFAVTIHTGVSAAAGAGIATGNILEYILVWLAMRPLLRHRHLTLERVAEVLSLAAAAALAPSVAALIGTASLCLAGIALWEAYWATVTTYWLGDAAGILMVAPFLIGWRAVARASAACPSWRRPAQVRRLSLGSFSVTR